MYDYPARSKYFTVARPQRHPTAGSQNDPAPLGEFFDDLLFQFLTRLEYTVDDVLGILLKISSEMVEAMFVPFSGFHTTAAVSVS